MEASEGCFFLKNLTKVAEREREEETIWTLNMSEVDV